MVEIMEKVWGDLLVKDVEPEDVKELPSPEALRRKIVVKVCSLPVMHVLWPLSDV